MWIAEGKASAFDGNEREITSIRKKMQALSAERQAEKGVKEEEFLLLQKKYVEAVSLRESLASPQIGEAEVTLPIRKREEAKRDVGKMIEEKTKVEEIKTVKKEESSKEKAKPEEKEIAKSTKEVERKEEPKEEKKKEEGNEAAEKVKSEEKKGILDVIVRNEKKEEKKSEAKEEIKGGIEENVKETKEEQAEVAEKIEEAEEKKNGSEVDLGDLINDLTPPILSKWLKKRK